MNVKNLILVLSMLLLSTLACRLFIPGTPTPEPPPTQAPVPQGPGPSETGTVDMAARLEELGGQRCQENPEFTCVSIQVPLDHFDAANSETLDVMFAVAPATGERYGMYVQAFPGGPGGEGISTGGLFWFPESLLEHYDIVYFDQRGVGLSDPLACPAAYARDFLGYFTRRRVGTSQS